jgi:hypothetical protein
LWNIRFVVAGGSSTIIITINKPPDPERRALPPQELATIFELGTRFLKILFWPIPQQIFTIWSPTKLIIQ